MLIIFFQLFLQFIFFSPYIFTKQGKRVLVLLLKEGLILCSLNQQRKDLFYNRNSHRLESFVPIHWLE